MEETEPLVLEGAQRTICKGVKHIVLGWKTEAGQNKTELLKELFANYKISQIVKTPFLIKATCSKEMQKIDISSLHLKKNWKHVLATNIKNDGHVFSGRLCILLEEIF